MTGGHAAADARRREPGVLRLLTWNVRDLLDDPLAVDRVLAAAAADVVCLQEAPRVLRPVARLAGLARRAGLFYVAGGRAGGGTGVLASARVRVLSAEAFRLPVAGFGTRPRGAVHATVAMPAPGGRGGVLDVACVHLGTDPAERELHVGVLLERLCGARNPLVVAGDLNEPPDSDTWRRLAGLVIDPAPDAPPTFPARNPARRLDAVLTGPGVTVAGYARWAPDRRDAVIASDHLPVLAEIAV